MGYGQNFSALQSFLFYLLFLWSIVWKGLSTWNAAKNNQRNWFIALLILNTVGILEIIYLFRFAKKRMTLIDVRNGLKKVFFSKSK